MLEDSIIRLYFEYNKLVKQQIDSFNHFIDYGLQKVVDSVGVIETNVEGFSIKLGKIKIDSPRYYEVRGGYRAIMPTEAMIRNLTYASPLFLEMIPIYNGVPGNKADVFIGEIPVMVKSKICHLANATEQELIEYGFDPMDPGGYFIINGSERVLVSLEDLVSNKVLVTKNDDGTITAKVFSTIQNFRAKCTVNRSKEGGWTLEFPSSVPQLPLISMLRTLGLDEDEMEELFSTNTLVYNDYLYNLEHEPEYEGTPEEYLAKRLLPGQPKEFQMNRLWYLVDNHLLPHIGTTEDVRKAKAYYLVKMAERTTLLFFNRISEDDKDHYGNKRIKLAGDLMEELFAYAFKFLVRDIIYQAGKADIRGRKLQVYMLVRQDVLTERILYSMATGNWIAGQTGVSQLLDRTSYMSSISHRRRLISPLSKKHPHFLARDLHGTQYGRVCPSETPEGPSTSLVKNLALMAEITTDEIDTTQLKHILKNLGVK